MSEQIIDQGPIKKIKLNNQNCNNDKQWIVVKKKTTPLTIAISDHSKVNKYYSHKSIQKYIRYLLTQTCPNPMWLAIKRQSQIQHIYYIDIQIDDYLFQKMLQNKQLSFFSEKITFQNKAVFKQMKLNRYFWDNLFIYDQEIKSNEQVFQQFIQTQRKMCYQIYQKYLQNLLTNTQMRQNLYPDLNLPLYKNYHKITFNQNIKQEKIFNNKNLILVIDCQMVTTEKGFQLARCTIVNYQQEIIFDQFFKPQNPILNYNTQFSGITKNILDPVINTIQNKLHPFLNQYIQQDTILIGHSLENDFNAMKFFHPKVVDSSVLFRRKNGCKMKLKFLADKILKRKIQHLTHDSKEDCLATLHLVQLKVQNQKSIEMAKEYHLLADLLKFKKSALIIDHQTDKFRAYNSIHFQKTQLFQQPRKICQILKKYSNKNQVAVPKICFTRFQKNQNQQWQKYYSQIDESLKLLYEKIPQGSVYFLNFQINQLVRIIPFTKQQNQKVRSRPFLALIPKS